MSNLEMWEVFIQTKPGLSHKHAGTVQAATAEMALQAARDVYTRRMEGTSIWVVPSKYLVTSEGIDKEIELKNPIEKNSFGIEYYNTKTNKTKVFKLKKLQYKPRSNQQDKVS